METGRNTGFPRQIRCFLKPLYTVMCMYSSILFDITATATPDLEKLPFSEHAILDGVHVLCWNPVDPIPGRLRRTQLQGQHVIFFVALDGLGNHALDRVHGHFLGAFFGTDPNLIQLHLEGQSDLAAVLIEHT